jgi:thiol-disulfide isomerase/thioredoxin
MIQSSLLGWLIALAPCAPAVVYAAPATGMFQAPPADPYVALERQLGQASQAFQTALTAAKEKGLPEHQWPKQPLAAFYPLFEQLAATGNERATRWCLWNVPYAGLPDAELVAKKRDLYGLAFAAFVDQPWMSDALELLMNETPPKGLSFEEAAGFCKQLSAATENEELRGQALWAQAVIYGRSTLPAQLQLSRDAYTELANRQPETSFTQKARGRLFQLDYLQVGKTPDFTTQDIDGVEFKLSDYRGKVVVLDFWGLWCPPCRAQIPAAQGIIERNKDKPFAFIGINTDTNKDDFRRQAEPLGINWRNSWQGGRDGPLTTQWGIMQYPAIYVLDHKGVIRYINPRGKALDTAVDQLVAVAEAEARQAAASAAKSAGEKTDSPKPQR